MLVEKFEYYKIPWNVKEVFYVNEEDWWYSLYNEKWLVTKKSLFKDLSLDKIEQFINAKILKDENKGYIISQTTEFMDIEKFCIFLWIEFNLRKIPEEIDIYETDNFTYYFFKEINKENDNDILETNHYYIFNEYNEYIWRFELTRSEDKKWEEMYYLWSIFISDNMQRKWYFTHISITDLPSFVPSDIDWLYVYSILDWGLPFYEKLEKLWHFEFMDDKKNGFLTFS